MFDYETAAKIIRIGTVKVDDKVILFVNTAKWNYNTCQQLANTVADLRNNNSTT